jgi:hypothetical protein
MQIKMVTCVKIYIYLILDNYLVDDSNCLMLFFDS